MRAWVWAVAAVLVVGTASCEKMPAPEPEVVAGAAGYCHYYLVVEPHTECVATLSECEKTKTDYEKRMGPGGRCDAKIAIWCFSYPKPGPHEFPACSASESECEERQGFASDDDSTVSECSKRDTWPDDKAEEPK